MPAAENGDQPIWKKAVFGNVSLVWLPILLVAAALIYLIWGYYQ